MLLDVQKYIAEHSFFEHKKYFTVIHMQAQIHKIIFFKNNVLWVKYFILDIVVYKIPEDITKEI